MPNESSVYVVARLIALPEKTESLKALLVGLISPTRTEKGCLSYELWQNQSDPNDFTFVERWESVANLEAHLSSQHIQDAIAQLDGLVATEPDIRRYTQIS